LRGSANVRNIAAVNPTAKSLILDLLSTVPSKSMPVRALIAAGGLFGIDANAIRVAAARLVSEGLVESDERGAYRAAPKAEALLAYVADWRTVEDRVRAWDGAWIGALTSALPRSQRARVRASERALHYLGFRDLGTGLAIRPHNLADGTRASRERLAALGLDPRVAVFEIRNAATAFEESARGLWDTERLNRRYRDLRATIEASAARVARLPKPKAMAESFLVGGSAIRALVLDPLLPEPLVSVADRRRLVAAMKGYDRLGRQCWSEFMREHGAPYLRAPHDVRALETARAASVG
jgi:phenylacetic acid degradation operon negative regulatory protein